MPQVRFDTYYRYEELTRLLHAFAEEYPQLVRITSIGKSYEGRGEARSVGGRQHPRERGLTLLSMPLPD